MGSSRYGNFRQLTKLRFQSVRDGIQNVWFQVAVLNCKMKTKIILCVKTSKGLLDEDLGVLTPHQFKFLMFCLFVHFTQSAYIWELRLSLRKVSLRYWRDCSESAVLATQVQEPEFDP